MHVADILRETESLNASRTSVNRSLGKARETLSLWRPETPVEPNFAFWVLQAIRKGDMK
jgi:hypothetical protein